MRFLFKLILPLIFSCSVHASGMPIFDGQEVMKQISDSLYFLTAIDGLLKEVGGTSSDREAVGGLVREIRLYQEQIYKLQALQNATDDVANPRFTKSKVLADQINSVSQHIRKLKTVLTLASSIGARPEAINASMQVLRDERQREREKFELAFKAIEEQEKIYDLRKKIEKRVTISKSINSEFESINKMSNGSGVKIVSIKRQGKKKGIGDLW